MADPRRLLILIVTHSPALYTGMAETTRSIFHSLLQLYPDGYELHHVGLHHVAGVAEWTWPIHLTRIEVSTQGRLNLATSDLNGQETVPMLLETLKPDIVFAFNDPQHLQYLVEVTSRRQRLILYVNVDGFPAPPDYSSLFRADKIITMSNFAMNALLAGCPASDPDKVDFMYAPADIDRFRPASMCEREKLRQEWLPPWMPDTAFILGWVGINQWRKQVWVLYEVIHLLRSGQYLVCSECQRVTLRGTDAWNREMGAVPERTESLRSGAQICTYCGSGRVDGAEPLTEIFLWLHMPQNLSSDCWPRDALHEMYDVRPGRDVHYTDGLGSRPHLGTETLPVLYKVWDGLLYLSGGEGFGVPVLEAMSSELPAVYTNYSSHAEILEEAEAGLPVGGILQPEASTCALRIVADAVDVLEAVRKLYFEPALRKRLGMNGRAFAEKHSRRIQAERWHRIFRGAGCDSHG